MSWKHALYDFIHSRNQMEVDYRWPGLASMVVDEAWLDKERTVQERRRSAHRERGAEPVRSETRLRIAHVETAAGKMTADTEIYSIVEMDVRGRKYAEEKKLGERIILSMFKGKWKVEGVTPSAGPAGAQGVSLLTQAGDDMQLPGLPSAAKPMPAPFINRSLILPSSPRRTPYNREAARAYAERWWNSANPDFQHFDVDCTNYVSQCLFAGGAPMNYTGKRESGWWYEGKKGSQELWSFSWAVAHALQLLLAGKPGPGLHAEEVSDAAALSIGDVICYDWDGSGRYGHSTLVTGFDGNGMPLVNAHTVSSKNRYWDYSDSYAWTQQTKYRFFHIPDDL